MRRLVLPFAALLLAAAHPQPGVAAVAQSGSDKLAKCVDEAMTSCDKDFPGNDYITISIRGWCYTIRTAICYAVDPEA